MTRASRWFRVAVTIFACLVTVATSVQLPVQRRVDAKVDSRVAMESGILVFLHEPPPCAGEDSRWVKAKVLKDCAQFSFVLQNTRDEDARVSTNSARLELSSLSIPARRGAEVTLHAGESARFIVEFEQEGLSSLVEKAPRDWNPTESPDKPLTGRVLLATVSFASGVTLDLRREVVAK